MTGRTPPNAWSRHRPHGASATDAAPARLVDSPTRPVDAATGRADSPARLAAPARRSRRQRFAHPRDHHPGHRAWFFATQTLGLDLPDLDWGQLWPVILIVLGGWIVYSSVRRAR